MQRLHSNLPLRRNLLRIVHVRSLFCHLVQVLQRKTRLQPFYFLRFIRKERREVQRPIRPILNTARLLRLKGDSLSSIEFEVLLLSTVVVRVAGSLLAESLLSWLDGK